MNKLAIIGGIALVSLCPSWQAVGQETDSTSTLFRYAELGSPGRINLGEPIGLLGGYGIREADGITRIPMSYPGTAWMRVYTDSNRQVGALYFSYNAAFDFAEGLTSYTEDLGKPEQDIVEGQEIYFWQDDQTRFELVRRTGDQGSQHFSILRDLALSSLIMLPDVTQVGTDTVSLSIEDILATTELWGFIVGKSTEFIDVISASRPDLHPDTLAIVSAAIEEHYAPHSLYSHVLQHMKEHSNEDVVVPLIDWLFDETMVRQRATVNEYEPELTIEKYASSLQESPPSPERVNFLMRFVKANHVGAFFLGLDTAVRGASNNILASLPGASELLPPPSIEESNAMAQTYELLAIMGFLWRYEPLTNEQIAQTVALYETDSGQWYVRAYTEALTSALTVAGENVAYQISGSQ